MTAYAHELRRHARKIGPPAGEVQAVMQAAAAHIDDLERRVLEADGRADALAATIHALAEVVTTPYESKAAFIARVKFVLSGDPDDRVMMAVEAEREACAKLCDDAINMITEAAIIGDERRDAGINACTNLAKRIRARGKQPTKGSS